MLMSMDPMMASLMKEGTDGQLDFPQMQKAAIDKRKFEHDISNDDRSYDLRVQEYNRGFGETIPQTTVDPSGAETTFRLPKFGAGGQSFMTKLSPVKPFSFTKDGVEYDVLRNEQTGEQVSTPIPKTPPKGEAAESSGKIAMAANAVQFAKDLRGMLFKGGKLDRGLIAKASAPLGGMGEGRMIKSMFRDAIDARIRAATGAAISKEEIPYYESVYLPSILDDDATAKNKMDRFDQFLNGYLETIDPNGSIRKRITSTESADDTGFIENKVYEGTDKDGKKTQAVYMGLDEMGRQIWVPVNP